MPARDIISTHPDVRGSVSEALVRCIDECYACAQACTACADVFETLSRSGECAGSYCPAQSTWILLTAEDARGNEFDRAGGRFTLG